MGHCPAGLPVSRGRAVGISRLPTPGYCGPDARPRPGRPATCTALRRPECATTWSEPRSLCFAAAPVRRPECAGRACCGRLVSPALYRYGPYSACMDIPLLEVIWHRDSLSGRLNRTPRRSMSCCGTILAPGFHPEQQRQAADCIPRRLRWPRHLQGRRQGGLST
jgi:hypothetical protein